MTAYTGGSFCSRSMKRMRRVIVCFSVTLQAGAIAGHHQFAGMMVMAIAAFNAPAKHFALKEGGVVVILIIYLAISKKVFGVRNFRNIIIHDLITFNDGSTYICLSCMAGRTGIDLADLAAVLCQV